MERLDLREWTPRNGQVRRYINNWHRIVGLEYRTYNTGNISSATLNGEPISNACARRILTAKVWLDEDDAVHVDYWSERDELTASDVKEKIAEALSPASGN